MIKEHELPPESGQEIEGKEENQPSFEESRKARRQERRGKIKTLEEKEKKLTRGLLKKDAHLLQSMKLRESLEDFGDARGRLAQAEVDMKKIKGWRGFLGADMPKEAKTIEDRDAIRDAIQEEHEQALEEYEIKRAEYIDEKVNRKLNEESRLADERAEVYQKEKGRGKKFYEWYKKLGKLNVARWLGPERMAKLNIREYDSRAQRIGKKAAKVLTHMLSVRTAISGAMLGAGFIFGGTAVASSLIGLTGARRALAALGGGVGSYDFMKMFAEKKEAKKGMRKEFVLSQREQERREQISQDIENIKELKSMNPKQLAQRKQQFEQKLEQLNKDKKQVAGMLKEAKTVEGVDEKQLAQKKQQLKQRYEQIARDRKLAKRQIKLMSSSAIEKEEKSLTEELGDINKKEKELGQEFKNMNLEEIEQRMEYFEVHAELSGEKASDNKTYKLLKYEFNQRARAGQVEKTIDELTLESEKGLEQARKKERKKEWKRKGIAVGFAGIFGNLGTIIGEVKELFTGGAEAAEAAEAGVEAAEKVVHEAVPTEALPETMPEHVEYQDGKSIWGEIENQMDDRSAFKEWYTSADEVERTYAIDYIKDKIVENPGDYGLGDDIDPDIVTEDQLKNIDWDKAFTEAGSVEELDKAMPELSAEAKESIIENNDLLTEYVSKSGEAIDSSTVDQVLADIKDAGSVDEYLQSLEAAEVVESVEAGEQYWQDLTDQMNEALSAGNEEQIKALVLEAVGKEPDWALDQNQTKFFLRVLEGNDGAIGKDFGGLVAPGNNFNKDTLDLAIEHFKEKAASGILPDSDMWSPRYIYDEIGQQQLANMRNTGSRWLPKYEIDYNGDGAVEQGDIVKGFGAKKELANMMKRPLDEVSIAAEEVEEAAVPVAVEQADALEISEEATPDERTAVESAEQVTKTAETVPTFEQVQAEPDTLLTSEDPDKLIQTINKFENMPEATKQELPGIIDTIKQEYPSTDKYILKEMPNGVARLDFYDEKGIMLGSSYTEGDFRAPLETVEPVLGEVEAKAEVPISQEQESFINSLKESHPKLSAKFYESFKLDEGGAIIREGYTGTYTLNENGDIRYSGGTSPNGTEMGSKILKAGETEWEDFTPEDIKPEAPLPVEESVPAEESTKPVEEKVAEESKPTEATVAEETTESETAPSEETLETGEVIADLGGIEEISRDPKKFDEFINATLEGNEKGQKIARAYFESFHINREVTGHAAEEAIRLANGSIPENLSDLILARQDGFSSEIEKLIQTIEVSGSDWGKDGISYESGSMSPEDLRGVYEITEMSKWVDRLGLDRKTFNTNRAQQILKEF